jgi:hypothetical protein
MGLRKQAGLTFFFMSSHYRNRVLCRAPTAHGTAFAVRILPKRMAKGARRIFTR